MCRREVANAGEKATGAPRSLPGLRSISIDLVDDLVYYGVMIEINIHEAKTHLSSLLRRVSAGEEVIIARAGKPVAKIVPIESARLVELTQHGWHTPLTDSGFSRTCSVVVRPCRKFATNRPRTWVKTPHESGALSANSPRQATHSIGFLKKKGLTKTNG